MRSAGLKLLLGPVLLGAAVLLAAAYGAVHNQISYSVGPAYFHDLKFAQFGIDPELQNRVGAAFVGVAASWWMGLVLGVPILLVCLFVRGIGLFATAFFRAAMIAVLVAMVVGLGGLAVGLATVTAETLPDAMRTRVTVDPVGFAHAGIMHDASYLGGLLGLICGCISAGFAAVRSRRS